MENDNKAPNHTLNCSPYLYTREEVGDLPVTLEPHVPFKSEHGEAPSGTEKKNKAPT